MSQTNATQEEVVRTIPASEVRIYRITVRLGDLSSPTWRNAKLLAKGPLPVYSEDMVLLGHGRVTQVGTQLMAEVEIDYHSEERLLAETGAEKLWLWPMGAARYNAPYKAGIAHGAAGIDLGTPILVRLIEIDHLIISRVIPTDPTSGRFGKDGE